MPDPTLDSAQSSQDAPVKGPTFLVLHWFRPNPTRHLVRAWVIGSVITFIGLIVGGLRFLQPFKSSEEAQAVATVTGLLLCMSGLIWAVRAALLALRDDTCLLIRNDGVEITDPPRFLPWDTIRSVTHNPDQRTIHINPPPPQTPLPIDARFSQDLPALAKLLLSTQRRALMGLIKGPPL